MTNVIYKQEELTTSRTYVDDSVALEDLTTYYWQVEAVDGYGARTLSTNGPFSFHTDNQNNIPGILAGLVYSDASFIGLAGATISVTVGNQTVSTTTETNGEYIILANSGSATITTSLTGYTDAGLGNINLAAGAATTDINLGMTPTEEPDTDGDGIADSADNCPNDANIDQADYDNDQIGDACDADDDNDGVDDNADAFPKDATETKDTDGDGIGDNSDNCPYVSNNGQEDSNGNQIGDACEEGEDGFLNLLPVIKKILDQN